MAKEIILYNPDHIGGVFFTQKIVKNFIISNSDYKFINCVYLNSGIFDTESTSPGTFPFLNQSMPFVSIQADKLVINLWIGAICNTSSATAESEEIECNPFKLNQKLISFFPMIKSKFGYDLKLNEYSPIELLPEIYDYPITTYLEWVKHKKQPIIWYTNFLPKSGQACPFDNHDKIINTLSLRFKECFILIPGETSIQNDNVISCVKHFGYGFEHSCKNLIITSKIASLCDIAVYVDVGASFFYVNNKFFENKSKIIHIGCTNKYFNIFKNQFSDGVFESKVTFLQSKNQTETEINLPNEIEKNLNRMKY